MRKALIVYLLATFITTSLAGSCPAWTGRCGTCYDNGCEPCIVPTSTSFSQICTSNCSSADGVTIAPGDPVFSCPQTCTSMDSNFCLFPTEGFNIADDGACATVNSFGPSPFGVQSSSECLQITTARCITLLRQFTCTSECVPTVSCDPTVQLGDNYICSSDCDDISNECASLFANASNCLSSTFFSQFTSLCADPSATGPRCRNLYGVNTTLVPVSNSTASRPLTFYGNASSFITDIQDFCPFFTLQRFPSTNQSPSIGSTCLSRYSNTDVNDNCYNVGSLKDGFLAQVIAQPNPTDFRVATNLYWTFRDVLPPSPPRIWLGPNFQSEDMTLVFNPPVRYVGFYLWHPASSSTAAGAFNIRVYSPTSSLANATVSFVPSTLGPDGRLYTTPQFFGISVPSDTSISEIRILDAIRNSEQYIADLYYTVCSRVLNVPCNLTVECGESSTEPQFTGEASLFNCACTSGRASYISNDTVIPRCGLTRTIFRTFSVQDTCGESDSGVQQITVVDTKAPSFTFRPADVTVECGTLLVPENTGGRPRASDICIQGVTVTNITYVDTNLTFTCGLSRVVRRAWTAVDQCGLSSSFTQVITVRDTTSPDFIGSTFPADTTVECCEGSTHPSITGTPTAADTCTSATRIDYRDVISSQLCGLSHVLNRTWVAYDACGNSRSRSQLITVRDTHAPTLTVPIDARVQCAQATGQPNPSAGVATAFDACSNAAQVSVSSSDIWTVGSCGNTGVISRIWTAVDACNLTTSEVQTITIYDDRAPTFTNLPSNVVIECGSSIDPTVTGQATATDVCGSVIVTYNDEIVTATASQPSCGQTGTIRRIWRAIDNCGNIATHIQVITVQDTIAPSFDTFPADIDYECCGVVPYPSVTGAPTASDAGSCSSFTIEYNDFIVKPASCDEVTKLRQTVYRTWTVTDDCGNSRSRNQTISIVDTILPTIVLPPTIDFQCIILNPSDLKPVYPDPQTQSGVVRAYDLCGAVVSIDYSDSDITYSCGLAGQFVRSWFARDECGNTGYSASNYLPVDQIINIVDTTAPVFVSFPDDTTVECGQSTNPAVMPVALDDCVAGNVVTNITYVDEVVLSSTSTGCGDTAVIRRTWMATDGCGNVASRIQSITLIDTTAPTFASFPADVTLECCVNPVEPQFTGTPTGADGCGSTSVSYTDFNVTLCPNSRSQNITRTWVLRDECGNSVSRSQRILVVDTTAPTLAIPSDRSVECATNFDMGVATATDACSPVVQLFDQDNISTDNQCGLTFVNQRRHIAVDSCNQLASAVQIINVIDTTPPTLTYIPSDVIIECGVLPIPANTNGSLTATDTCANTNTITITFSDESVPASVTCGRTSNIRRLWKATDPCGNYASHVQVIYVRDHTEPVWVDFPEDQVVECCSENTTEPSQTGMATAADTCGDVSVTFSDVVSRGCGNTLNVTRTWVAVDECGNSISKNQLIRVVDTRVPDISIPSNNDVECGLSTDVSATGFAVGSDSCSRGDLVSISSSDSVTDFPPNSANQCVLKSIARSWVAVDNCGNTNTEVQSIVVRDRKAPVFTVSPANFDAQCIQTVSIEPSATNGPAQATDSCFGSNVTVTYSDTIVGTPCGRASNRQRRWVATDPCGNQAIYDQLISVSDNIPPRFVTFPANMQVECCNSTFDPSVTGVPTAADDCADVSIEFDDFYDTVGHCGRTQRIVRTWTATDACGNTNSRDQIILVVDTKAPELYVPADINLRCDQSTEPLVTGSATAYDSCSVDTSRPVTHSDSVVQDTCQTTIVRTWSSIDECGNSVSKQQRIVISNVEVPRLVLPADATVNCGESVEPANTGFANSTNACLGTVTVSHTDTVAFRPCGGTLIIKRAWSAIDSCTNLLSTGIQNIYVDDRTPPTLNIPADIHVQCADDSGVENTGEANATDSCSSVDLKFVDHVIHNTSAPAKCTRHTILREWIAVDDCGNRVSRNQTILVSDTTPPTITVPGNVQVTFADYYAISHGANTTDNCDSVPTVNYNDFPLWVSPACYEQSISRTYTATDACGNTVSAVQTITLIPECQVDSDCEGYIKPEEEEDCDEEESYNDDDDSDDDDSHKKRNAKHKESKKKKHSEKKRSEKPKKSVICTHECLCKGGKYDNSDYVAMM